MNTKEMDAMRMGSETIDERCDRTLRQALRTQFRSGKPMYFSDEVVEVLVDAMMAYEKTLRAREAETPQQAPTPEPMPAVQAPAAHLHPPTAKPFLHRMRERMLAAWKRVTA